MTRSFFQSESGRFSAVALLLLLASTVTGIYWLAERFYFLPNRQKAAAALEANAVARNAELSKMGISKVDGDDPQTVNFNVGTQF